MRYWEKSPPVNETFALFVEYGQPSKGGRSQSTRQPATEEVQVDDRQSLKIAMAKMQMWAPGALGVKYNKKKT